MLRLVLSAAALAGVLAAARPAFADPVTATATDHAQPAAATTEQPASLPAVNAERGKAPVGFGWG